MSIEQVMWENMSVRFQTNSFEPALVQEAVTVAGKICPPATSNIPADVFVALAKDDVTKQVIAAVGQPGKEALLLSRTQFTPSNFKAALTETLVGAGNFLTQMGKSG